MRSGSGWGVAIYHVRCRELNLKNNFPSASKDKKCLFPSCMQKDSQEHVFSSDCFSTGSEIEIVNPNINYTDIFSSHVQLQVNIVNIMYAKLEIRRTFITLAEGFPLDPRGLSTLGIQKAKIKTKMKNRNRNQHKQTKHLL